MSRFRCKRFPQGVAHVRTRLGVVDFTDGEAVVDDPDLAQALLDVPAVFGIEQVGEREVKLQAGERVLSRSDITQIIWTAPGPRDPKAAWVEWAVHNGADRPEAESMTKKDLIAAFGE